MRWLRVAGSLALLALTAALLDLRSIAATVRHADGTFVLAALAVSVPLLCLLAGRWSFTAKRMGLTLPFGVALREYYVSTLLNNVLPGGILGDVSRVLRLSAKTPEQRGAIARSVVLERVSAQLVLWLVLVVGVFVWSLRGGDVGVEVPAAGLAAILIGIVLTLIFVAAFALRFPAVRSTRAGRVVARVVGDLRASMIDGRAWAWQLAGALGQVALLTIMFGLSTTAIGTPADPVQLLFIAPIVLAVSSLPISLGGWGVREITSAGLYEVVGLTAVDGAAAGAVFGAVSLLCTLPGAYFLWSPTRSTTPQGEPT